MNPTHSPEYKYSDRNQNMKDHKVEYPTGFDKNPGISNQEIADKAKEEIEKAGNSEAAKILKGNNNTPLRN